MACTSDIASHQKQVATFQGLGSRFLNANSFPRISFATLSLPRFQDGLGALDLAVQIQALQWRWLLPIALSCSPSIPVDSLFPSVLYSSVTYGLYLLKSTTPQPYLNHQITSASSLLFPTFRSKHFIVSQSSLLPLIPSFVLIQATPLLLSHPPLINCTPPLPQVCYLKTYGQMLGSHIMIFDSSTLRLRYRTFTRTEIRHFTRTTKQVINLLTSNIIQLRTFATTHFDNLTTTNNFVDHTTLILSIFNVDSVPNIPNKLLSPSRKNSKRCCPAKNTIASCAHAQYLNLHSLLMLPPFYSVRLNGPPSGDWTFHFGPELYGSRLSTTQSHTPVSCTYATYNDSRLLSVPFVCRNLTHLFTFSIPATKYNQFGLKFHLCLLIMLGNIQSTISSLISLLLLPPCHLSLFAALTSPWCLLCHQAKLLPVSYKLSGLLVGSSSFTLLHFSVTMSSYKLRSSSTFLMPKSALDDDI
ncbi:hypothetical protein G6F21_010164 [Rhizopus arrhizus]|nr:hypothetical protein G6F24_004175 [Rhizopus arrhizus]KAG0784037.1 hypothetical protein G6F21_010164 [Rhizopus arrhizus]KAG0952791.1 hypothetical protein G6F32_004427 [Rhizopus arrhizus]KAG0967821.1 hypothetical protein G6F31_003431 [Rhizopus arrhizus]KAG1107804.1 hypothetical protein G6F40_009741 [Rhizopus arrhizus]